MNETNPQTTHVLDRTTAARAIAEAAEKLAPGRTIRLAGLWGASAALTAAALARRTGRTVLFVARHLDDADEAADDIEVFSGSPAGLFPAWEVDLGTEHLNDEISGERLRVVNRLASGEAAGACFVAPVMAMLQPVPSREALKTTRLHVHRGMDLSPESLAEWLVDAGFETVEQVDQQGEFARRGGIVDIFCPGETQAVRLEFFGDEIDSIRPFDLDTQRSTDAVENWSLTAAAPAAGTTEAGVTLMDYLPDDSIVCLNEPGELTELAGELHRRIVEDAGAAHAFDPAEVFGRCERFAVAEMHTFAPKRGGSQTVDLGVRSLERLVVNTHEALVELGDLSEAADVWVYCENPAEQQRFREVLDRQHPRLAERVNLAIGHVSGGFYWPELRLVAVGHHEIFHRYARVRKIRRVRAGRPIESLLDLTSGDYVVHVAHGIGKFEGLRQLEREGQTEEFLTLRYAGNAVLHVPVSQINLVQKYIGSRRKRPSLSKLGGTSWSRAKQRVEVAVKDMAAEMLRIQAMRQASPGVSYPARTEMQQRFAAEFLYTETEDQLTSLEQIDADMSAARPMDRLLCGDVGYGKTELAMRAAFKVVEAGKQAAVLVPTTVLADQHFRTFRERFADYPIEVDVISRFRTSREQADIAKRLALGRIDVLIGTHRLLSKDIRFADLGLVVIDEEQRFGVEHKERLKQMRSSVEVLTMTATPIPRTLHMALLGLRDISSLTTPPLDRRAIHTEVVHYDEELIRRGIHRELNRGGQVFFVHNRVNNIRLLADRIRSLVPEARVAIGHGQMPEGDLEETMTRFVRHDFDVLVCTTIIESGLDIPSANTMFIHDADRFGLAELHQLRGRVGRYKHRAFCYLLLPQRRPVAAVAAKRLKAIEEFSDLGAGFQIAMRDLEIRGAGNILGREQSGHIATVGYELYCQLLDRAVGDLRGEARPVRRDVHLQLGMDVFIPKWYIPSERQRMEIYRRLVGCETPAALEQLAADLSDAYGKCPEMVEMLLEMAEIRLRAAGIGIGSVLKMPPDIIFSVRDHAKAESFLKDLPGSVRLPDPKTVHWRPPKAYLEPATLLRVLIRRLRQTDGDL